MPDFTNIKDVLMWVWMESCESKNPHKTMDFAENAIEQIKKGDYIRGYYDALSNVETRIKELEPKKG